MLDKYKLGEKVSGYAPKAAEGLRNVPIDISKNSRSAIGAAATEAFLSKTIAGHCVLVNIYNCCIGSARDVAYYVPVEIMGHLSPDRPIEAFWGNGGAVDQLYSALFPEAMDRLGPYNYLTSQLNLPDWAAAIPLALAAGWAIKNYSDKRKTKDK